MASTNRQLKAKMTQIPQWNARRQKQGLPSRRTIGPDKGERQQQGVEPDKRIGNQVAVWADSKTFMLKSFCHSQEVSWLLPSQVETYLIFSKAYTWWLATPGNTGSELLQDAASLQSTDPDKDKRGNKYLKQKIIPRPRTNEKWF